MKVILLDKKTEMHVHEEDVVMIQQKTEEIGFSGSKFRYAWELTLRKSPYSKSYPCNRYEIHAIIG